MYVYTNKIYNTYNIGDIINELISNIDYLKSVIDKQEVEINSLKNTPYDVAIYILFISRVHANITQEAIRYLYNSILVNGLANGFLNPNYKYVSYNLEHVVSLFKEIDNIKPIRSHTYYSITYDDLKIAIKRLTRKDKIDKCLKIN